MATSQVNALALDAYRRITIGAHDVATLAEFYPHAKGFVEYPHYHSLNQSSRQELSAFTADEITEAIAIAERWIESGTAPEA